MSGVRDLDLEDPQSADMCRRVYEEPTWEQGKWVSRPLREQPPIRVRVRQSC